MCNTKCFRAIMNGTTFVQCGCFGHISDRLSVCTGTDVEHNDTNLVGQSNDDVAKITEMTLINALHVL